MTNKEAIEKIETMIAFCDSYNLDRVEEALDIAIIAIETEEARKEEENRLALTRNIPVDRLKEIAEAEKDQRCVILPHRLDVQEVFIIEDDEISCIETFGEITIGQNIQYEFAFLYEGVMYNKEEIYTNYEDAEEALKERGTKDDL